MLKLDERSEGLTLSQRIRLAVFGRSYLGLHTRPGWNDSLPFHNLRCPEHRVVVDYSHGYGRRLVFPFCSRDLEEHMDAPDLDAEALETISMQ